MRYGSLTVFSGPMFADKTNSLVKEILFRTYFSGKDSSRAAIYKIGFDTRYDNGCIVSHDGLRVKARTIQSAGEIRAEGADWVFFDEIQFFTPPHFDGDIIDRIRELRAEGVDVFCAGLDMDFLGRAFEITALLMAEATKVERLRARCSVCGAPATHTARIDKGERRVELGSSETYSPMCMTHWFSDLKSGISGGRN